MNICAIRVIRGSLIYLFLFSRSFLSIFFLFIFSTFALYLQIATNFQLNY